MAIKWARLSLSWKRGIEVFSAFFFIMTMLTLEVICISVFAGIFVSLYQLSNRLSSMSHVLNNSFTVEQLAKRCALSTLFSCTLTERRMRTAAEVKGNELIDSYSNWPLAYRFNSSYEFMRSFFLWKHFVDYFPSILVKTVDIPANKNYIFVCFPHGVIRWSSDFKIFNLRVFWHPTWSKVAEFNQSQVRVSVIIFWPFQRQEHRKSMILYLIEEVQKIILILDLTD